MKAIFLLVLLFFSCSEVVSSDSGESDGRYTLSTTRIHNLGSVHIAPAVPVSDALSIFEPRLSGQDSSAFQVDSFADQVCKQHGIRQRTLIHTALQRHCAGEPATRSTEDLKEVLLGVLEKSELLIQQKEHELTNKDEVISRQETLFENQQEKADKDKKRWACGSVVATVLALMAPLTPLVAAAYTSIAGQCAEQCAELCSS